MRSRATPWLSFVCVVKGAWGRGAVGSWVGLSGCCWTKCSSIQSKQPLDRIIPFTSIRPFTFGIAFLEANKRWECMNSHSAACQTRCVCKSQMRYVRPSKIKKHPNRFQALQTARCGAVYMGRPSRAPARLCSDLILGMSRLFQWTLKHVRP